MQLRASYGHSVKPNCSPGRHSAGMYISSACSSTGTDDPNTAEPQVKNTNKMHLEYLASTEDLFWDNVKSSPTKTDLFGESNAQQRTDRHR